MTDTDVREVPMPEKFQCQRRSNAKDSRISHSTGTLIPSCQQPMDADLQDLLLDSNPTACAADQTCEFLVSIIGVCYFPAPNFLETISR